MTTDVEPPPPPLLPPQPLPPPPPLTPQPAASDARPQFLGTSRDFRRLAIRGALLEFVTFGFYRFWLATQLRRHLWSNTLIDGEPLEYMGTAKELFIGFLFALAILVPIYFLYFLAGIEAERVRAFASAPLFLFFYAFGQFANYRARRYRLTRTTWRGVRFWMEGSGFGYAWRGCLWGLLVYLTVGLALPWRAAALERYKMRRTHYGDLQGAFVGTGWQFFKQGWWLWLLAWLPLAVLIGGTLLAVVLLGAADHAASGTGTSGLHGAGHRGAAHVDKLAIATGAGVIIGCVIAAMLPFVYAAFKAAEWRWWLAGLRFGKLGIKSELKLDALFGNYWATIGWSILFFSVFGLVLTAVVLGLGLARGEKLLESAIKQAMQGRSTAYLLLGLYFVTYLATLLATGAAVRIFLLRGVWQKIMNSLRIEELAAAEAVTARGEAVNALGEGFADSLDIAGF